ncbi:MAG: hypothetical protein OEL77_08330 [Nitrosopumilus sp.]|nr:hypothetical protein [Nitrosopumilus sp.]
MKGQYSLAMDSVNISQTRTIVPRLYYSNDLLAKIIDVLNKEKSKVKKSNKVLVSECNDQDPACIRAIDMERTISFSLEILCFTQKRLQTISRIDDIPKIFPSLVPMMRTISAQLVDILPESSRHLSELSVHLGSIILDSATLTTAQFDFSHSNTESSLMLDEVKLMVDCKLSKQYPHLDFF